MNLITWETTLLDTSTSTALGMAAPPSRFNFAQHLLTVNTMRAANTAFIDDLGRLSYGNLELQVRLLAAGLRALGLRREERVLLLMQDTCHWPVAFLGAMYAGMVPVAVNTLLTADDYAYMLENSRAQVVLVSGALLPMLTTALGRAEHDVQQVIVSRPQAAMMAAQLEFDTFLAAQAPAATSAATSADEAAFWLYSSGSTGRPKATAHSRANPYWTAELYSLAPPQALQACWRTRSCRRARRWRCAWCPPLAKRYPQNWVNGSSVTSVSTSWTASAPPKCCTSICPTDPNVCATAAPAGPCRATKWNCDPTAARCPTVNPATCSSKAPAQR